jgi:hypothetical protein
MVTSPTRSTPSFDATLSATAPDALPLSPEATVIHPALLAAVHAHPVNVVTSTDNRPPAGPIASRVRLSV